MSKECRHSTASHFGTQGRYCNHCHFAVTETADERDARHRTEGAKAERERIVAYLRNWGMGDKGVVADCIADAIERGDHEPKESGDG